MSKQEVPLGAGSKGAFTLPWLKPQFKERKVQSRDKVRFGVWEGIACYCELFLEPPFSTGLGKGISTKDSPLHGTCCAV